MGSTNNMKNLTFYEVNENTTLPEMTETEGNVFDAINNAGAVTERGLSRLLGELTTPETRHEYKRKEDKMEEYKVTFGKPITRQKKTY